MYIINAATENIAPHITADNGFGNPAKTKSLNGKNKYVYKGSLSKHEINAATAVIIASGYTQIHKYFLMPPFGESIYIKAAFCLQLKKYISHINTKSASTARKPADCMPDTSISCNIVAEITEIIISTENSSVSVLRKCKRIPPCIVVNSVLVPSSCLNAECTRHFYNNCVTNH